MAEMKLRWAISTAAVLVLAVVLAACGGDDKNSGGGGGGGGDKKPLNIAVFTYSFDNTYANAYIDVVNNEAKKLGVTVKLFDGKFDAATQIGQVNDAIASGTYDGLAIAPVDGVGVIPAIKDAAAADTPVVCFGSPCGKDPATIEPQVDGQIAYIGVNAAEDGAIIADLMGEACKDVDPCEAGYLQGFAANTSDIARLAQLKDGLKEHPNVKLVAVAEGQFDQAASFKVTQDILQAHPNLKVIASGGDQMTFGAEEAAKQAGVDGVGFIGNTASTEGIQATRDGRWFGSPVWLPKTEAKLALNTLVADIRGEKKGQSIDVRERSPVGPAVTRDNAADWDGQWTISGSGG
jgi:ribose transport system substrate-binding protein